MNTVRLARHMMATRFELLLFDGDSCAESPRGMDEAHLRALGEAAFDEIENLEKRFSFYLSSSELSRLNENAWSHPVRIAPDFLDLLCLAKRMFVQTGGAFDPTVGPMMKRLFPADGTTPDADEFAWAASRIGMDYVHIDDAANEVSFDIDGVEVDLGGIAKGYAIERAIEWLHGAGISNALLHGGTSSVATLGTSVDGLPWKIGISDQDRLLATIELENASLSVSAQSGKTRTVDDIPLGHIIDPRSGRSVIGATVAAATGQRASVCDALSTALLVLGSDARSLASETTGIAIWTSGEKTITETTIEDTTSAESSITETNGRDRAELDAEVDAAITAVVNPVDDFTPPPSRLLFQTGMPAFHEHA